LLPIDFDHVFRAVPDWIVFEESRLFSAIAKERNGGAGTVHGGDYKPGINGSQSGSQTTGRPTSMDAKLPYLDSYVHNRRPNACLNASVQARRNGSDHFPDSEYFDKLARTSQTVHDAGASLDSEQLWCNEVEKLRPLQKENWFHSAGSGEQFCGHQPRQRSRVVFHGTTLQPAVGHFSPAQ